MILCREQDAADILTAIGLVRLAEKVLTLKLVGADIAQYLEASSETIFSLPSLEVTIGNMTNSTAQNQTQNQFSASFISDDSPTPQKHKDRPGYIGNQNESSLYSKTGSNSNTSVRSQVEDESSYIDNSSVSTEIVELQVFEAYTSFTCLEILINPIT